MSDNDQKSGKVIRTSSGSTRFSAGGGKSSSTTDAPRTETTPIGSGPAAGTSGTGGGTSGAAAGAPGAAAGASGTGAGAPGAAAGASGTQTKAFPPVGAGTAQTGTAPASTAPASVSSGGARLSAGSGQQKTTASRPAGGDRAAGGAADVMGESPMRASSGGVKMGEKAKKKGPRTVRLTVAKLDPWSVMKMSFLLSVAIGIATVVAALVLWLVLQATGTLQGMQTTLSEIAGTEGAEQLLGLFSLGRVLSFSVILALVNIVLMTALSTLFAFLYNIGASIVGGFHLTLTDD